MNIVNGIGNGITTIGSNITSMLPFNVGKPAVSQQELLAAIKQVSSDFEKVYTSINKLNSSVSEGAEQTSVYTVSLKKKFQELKKVLLQQPGNVTADAAAKNAEIVKIQEKIRSLKAQGKKDDVASFEKKLAEVNEQFNTLMSPEAAQVQKSAICRNIVGIVDTLGQVVFKTVSDEFAVRDSIKAYLISTINAKKLTTGNKEKTKQQQQQQQPPQQQQQDQEKKEEKGTVERMSMSLLKIAGVFLDLGAQVGLEFPAEYLSEIKSSPPDKTLGGTTVATHISKIDQKVRHLNTVSRNEKIDALMVDELVREVEEIVETMKAVESLMGRIHRPVQQAVSESQAAINVADYEADPTNFKIPPIRSQDEAVTKLKSLIKVMHEYLVPSLVATPLVYLQDKSWGLKSHSEFRAARRKELNALLPHVTPNMPLDALRECISEFAQVFILILHVKIPAMSEVHPDDSSILKRVKWAPERATMRSEIESELERLSSAKTRNSPSAICLVVQNLLKTAMRFLTFKPVARPHVFRSDAEWTLVSESKLRFQWRKELLM